MLTLGYRFALAGLFMLAALGSAGAAQTLTERQVQEAERFAANNSLFVLYHEIAHLLVDQLGLPVLGKEEDAADNMATYTLIKKQTSKSDQTLTDAARGWLLSGISYGTNFELADFYDEHSLDHQRAYQIVCLMVGSNPEAFAKVADDYEMDRDRQETCRFDYELVARSIESVLGSAWGKNAQGTEIEIFYQDASGELGKAASAFRRSRVFDDVAEEIKTNYSLPNRVSFRAQRCGEPNAFYDPDVIEVIFCYELMDDFMSLISKEMPEDTAVATAATEGTGLGRAGGIGGY